MNKLTIFTVILSIVVISVMAELVFNNYISGVEEGTASVLSTQTTHPSLVSNPTLNDTLLKAPVNKAPIREIPVIIDQPADIDPGFEDVVETASDEDFDLDALLRGDSGTENGVNIEIIDFDTEIVSNASLQRAGFPGAELVAASFDGFVYQTVDITDLSIDVKKEYIATSGEVYGAIYSFSVDENKQNELYKILRERAAFGESVEVNETNTFSDNSFYMNDYHRESTAFLVVRSGNRFYAFAYPKKFHQYFKPLAQNL